MKLFLKKISHSRMEPIFYFFYELLTKIEYLFLSIKWKCKGYRKPSKIEQKLVVDNVTFIYKSFERQRMAKKLYKNIQSYYPGAKVIIADDSLKRLKIKNKRNSLKIIYLPFNSGLSFGLNKALDEVRTPFVMRMDDDELLTPLSNIGNELLFLMNHHEIDLVGFGVMSTPKCESPIKTSIIYYKQPMYEAPKFLKIPHLTIIDKKHIVVGKTPNIFLVRTVQLKQIRWDNNIRMIDHNEFFMRAAGNIVSVINPYSIIFHYHNPFDSHYQKYRGDVQNDRIYIMNKYRRFK